MVLDVYGRWLFTTRAGGTKGIYTLPETLIGERKWESFWRKGRGKNKVQVIAEGELRVLAPQSLFSKIQLSLDASEPLNAHGRSWMFSVCPGTELMAYRKQLMLFAIQMAACMSWKR